MSKWICDCMAINASGAFNCFNCGIDYQATKTSEKVTNDNLSNKPREFWIENGSFIYGCTDKKENLNGWNTNGEGPWHVIEYSAYEKLKNQNEILTEALKKISADFGTDYCDGNTIIAKEALDKVGNL